MYTKGKSSGVWNYSTAEAGAYEARAYHNWPQGGTLVKARAAFEVLPAKASGAMSQGGLFAEKSEYRVGETIIAEYRGLPGNKQDWITLIEAGAPDDAWGDWFYTQGKTRGNHSYTGKRKVGEYELRLYHHWPQGKYAVQERFRLSIRP